MVCVPSKRQLEYEAFSHQVKDKFFRNGVRTLPTPRIERRLDIFGIRNGLYDRKIIGYAYGTSMTAELALEAVKNACLNVADTKEIILHSDLGSQYTSQVFENYLTSKGMVNSFSRKGNPYENVQISSLTQRIDILNNI